MYPLILGDAGDHPAVVPGGAPVLGRPGRGVGGIDPGPVKPSSDPVGAS
jgi:hypothetical protein